MNRRPFILIVLVGFILTLPVLFYGAPFRGDDAVIHASWYIHFSEQFWSGDLYPRWLVGMNHELGSPVFFYYPPVPYFLTSLLRPFFANDPFGWYQLGVSASLATVFSGLFAYLWLKQLVNETSAVIAAILYMAGPYHLAADLYIRFSFAEYWAFVWLPLILYFTHRIVHGKRLAFIGFAIGYGLLIMTHLPTTLIFSLIPITYAFVLKTDQRVRTLGRILVSMVAGIGLSAIYLYPAMSMQKYVFLDRMGTGYFSFENWLFFINFSLWTEDKSIILLLVLDLLGIAVCAFVISRTNTEKREGKLRLFWLFTAIGSALMMTELSKPIWLIFYPLQWIQFPFRFSVILTLAVTVLGAFALSNYQESRSSTNIFVKIFCFLLIVSWIPVFFWAVLTAFSVQDTERQTIIHKVELSREAPEYRPRWNESMKKVDWEISKDIDNWDTHMEKEYGDLLQRVGETKAGVLNIKIVEGMGQVDVVSWKSREIILRAKADSEMKIHVSQFYFPNWTALIEVQQNDLTVEPSQPDGLLSLTIPNGDYDIKLTLTKSTEEITGQLISIISIVCLMIYVAAIGKAKMYRRKIQK